MRRARVQLQEIKRRIANGTFVFAEEFPEYRYMEQLGGDARGTRTCNDIFNAFMTHCESRMSKNDLAFATYESYRKILDSVWRPAIGTALFDRVKYSPETPPLSLELSLGIPLLRQFGGRRP